MTTEHTAPPRGNEERKLVDSLILLLSFHNAYGSDL
jgi:hypothetical protein